MSTIPIYEDQENRIPDLPQQKGANEMAGQQKRPVLATINNQRERAPRSKQPLNIKAHNNEKTLNKQNAQKVSAPVVPVAQFEAFKVYEDSQIDEINKRLQRLKKKNAYDVYKGTEEDRYVTKREIEIMLEQQKQQEAILPLPPVDKISLDPPHCRESPMSIEKSCEPLQRETVSVKTHVNRDLFFEMEEYREEIYKYLRVHETHNRPKPGYMRKQPDIDTNMRAILIDWLVEVAEEYRLQTETLYLAVNFIDRFLSYMSVVRAKLQLVGTAAMFIASKYEEICPPAVSEFVYITDNTYKKEQVLRMEHLILKVLSFDLSIPTPLTFITAISITVKLDRKTMCFALYLTELSMLEVEHYLQTLPSVLASSAIAVARNILGETAWSEQLESMTGYKLSDLQETVMFLSDLAIKAPNMAQQAIQEKYKSLKFLHVAKIPVTKVDITFDSHEQ